MEFKSCLVIRVSGSGGVYNDASRNYYSLQIKIFNKMIPKKTFPSDINTDQLRTFKEQNGKVTPKNNLSSSERRDNRKKFSRTILGKIVKWKR